MFWDSCFNFFSLFSVNSLNNFKHCFSAFFLACSLLYAVRVLLCFLINPHIIRNSLWFLANYIVKIEASGSYS